MSTDKMTPELFRELLKRLVSGSHRDALYAGRILIGVAGDELYAVARAPDLDFSVHAQALVSSLHAAHESRIAMFRRKSELDVPREIENDDESASERLQEELLEIEVAISVVL